ncbi:MAG: FAD binding domain-containing protein [Bacteroidota bacterium]
MTGIAQTYLRPSSLRQALQQAEASKGDFRYLAGGTDILVNKFQGNAATACLIDLTGITELSAVRIGTEEIRIGSLVRLSQLEEVAMLAARFPALIESAQAVATPVIRQTATLGGNLLCQNRCIFYNQSEWWRKAAGYCLKCNGPTCLATGGKSNCFSRFVSDTAPVLIALNATVDIEDVNGTVTLPLENIYSGIGLAPLKLVPASILKSINLPLRTLSRCLFRKLRVRHSMDFTSLTAAVSKDAAGNIRIAVGGVDPGPVLVTCGPEGKYADLIGQAVKKSRIVNNDVFSRRYKKGQIEVFLLEMLQALAV